jgi:hypothetical protein
VSEDVRIVVGRIDISREMLEGVNPRFIEWAIRDHARRMFCPWEFPDPPATFDVTLFPRLERIARRIRWRP